MTRSKKSRKPGVGSSGAPKPKLDKATLAQVEKRQKKKNGKVAGNRQLEATQNKKSDVANKQKKDPRLGNKTPIVLTKSTSAQPVAKTKAAKQKPIAAVRAVEPSQIQTQQQRLIEIEQDEKLLAIVAKQDEEQPLTDTEIDYFNNLMDEHAQLSDALGLTEEDEIEEPAKKCAFSEDDLWDKLDSSDLSTFGQEED